MHPRPCFRRGAPRRTDRDDGGDRDVGDDRGQAAVLVLAVVAALLVTMILALSSMGRVTVDRTRAQTAADAAALASLVGGRGAAVDLAGRHGANVTAWSQDGDEVTVTVRLGDVTATARATNAP